MRKPRYFTLAFGPFEPFEPLGLESKKLGMPLKGSISSSSMPLLVLGTGEVSARLFFFLDEDFFLGDLELLGVSRIDADCSSESSAAS